jgi:2-phosphosulfolactate phosphatase
MNKIKPTADVIFSPALIDAYELEGKVAVVIDILRATSTICYALFQGAKAIIPISSLNIAEDYKRNGYLAAAERNGVPASGFELGNSPQAFSSDLVKGKTIALTTTNGTKALLRCQNADQILIGSFFNLSLICHWLVSQQKDLLLVCAGWKDKFNLEDTLYAGAILQKIQSHFTVNSDASSISLLLFENSKNNLKAALENCSHSRRFRSLEIDDLEFCLQTDITPIIPEFKNGFIQAMKINEPAK